MNIFKNRRNNIILESKSLTSKPITDDNRIKDYAPGKKIDDFIEWYFINYAKGHYTDIGEINQPNRMRDKIEKMAVWYELRYPEYEVSKIYPGSNYENLSTDKIYLRNNPAIKKVAGVLNDEEQSNFCEAIKLLKWSDLNSYQAYLTALPWNEKWFLIKPRFSDVDNIVYIKEFNHLHLDHQGIVTDCEIFKNVNNGQLGYYDFVGWTLEDVIRYLKSIDYPLQSKDRAIKTIELKDHFLEAVMYRIIERGGVRIGSRRAFMFAQEFNQDIDIPLVYAIDTSDPGLRDFINQYLKAGGNPDLSCLVNYKYRKNDQDPLTTVTIQELMKTLTANGLEKYTPEEKALQQKLVDDLSVIAEQSSTTEQPQQLVLKPKNKRL